MRKFKQNLPFVYVELLSYLTILEHPILRDLPSALPAATITFSNYAVLPYFKK